MIKNWLFGLAKKSSFTAPIAPDQDFIAVGDIHGRYDLLERLLLSKPTQPIICVGDYIDRGDQSADVLRMLHSRPDITCLMGNHEEMMLNFLRNPQRHGGRWLRYGGLQTLASFGLSGISDTANGDALDDTCDALKQAMGEDLINWVMNLPKSWQSGNVAVVHAAADPDVPIEGQTQDILMWGHPDFGNKSRQDDIWVLHGHTIVDQAIAKDGVISIDTGAYATGRLTYAIISNEAVKFHQA